MRWNGEIRVALGGALGGALNAWLCFAGIPVAVPHSDFAWHLIPAGAFHGAVLAAAAHGFGVFLAPRSAGIRLIAALPLAWISGFIAWIPLSISAFQEPWTKSLLWPFHVAWDGTLLDPLRYFGFVTLCYYLAFAWIVARKPQLAVHIACASLAGILGSLWWWISIEPWYFSVIHGVIWGTCVGTGAWTAARRFGVVSPAAL
jgi:hypothetical protein